MFNLLINAEYARDIYNRTLTVSIADDGAVIENYTLSANVADTQNNKTIHYTYISVRHNIVLNFDVIVNINSERITVQF